MSDVGNLRKITRTPANSPLTGEGLLIRVIWGVSLRKLAPTRRLLITRYGIPAELIIVDQQSTGLSYTHAAEKLTRLEPGLKFVLVEEPYLRSA